MRSVACVHAQWGDAALRHWRSRRERMTPFLRVGQSGATLSRPWLSGQTKKVAHDTQCHRPREDPFAGDTPQSTAAWGVRKRSMCLI